MQRKGVLSNQDCLAVNLVSEIAGVLGRPEVQWRLSGLAKKLAALRASDGLARIVKPQRKRARRPGWVRDAVVRVLDDHGGPMRVTQIHEAIETLLGEPVSIDSVSWVLAWDVRGPSPAFVRVARGRYVLASTP